MNRLRETPRAPIFALLDALIAADYGDVPRVHIPDNWREIPREVNQHDLERVRAEELTPEKERIAEIERYNSHADPELAARVLANAAERQKPGPKRGYIMPPSTRRHQYRGKYKKKMWREAATRARRSVA